MRARATGLTFDVESEQLELILTKIETILTREILIMATLDELKALGQAQIQKIDSLNTTLDSFRALFDQIKAELDALKASGIGADAQAKVNELADLMIQTIAKIDETAAENPLPVTPPTGNEI